MELALVLPLLFVFVFTVAEFGIALEHSLSYAHAARTGARAAALGSTQSNVLSKVQGDGGCTPSATCTIQVNYTDTSNGNGKGGDVGDSTQVKIIDNYKFVTPLQSLLSVFGVGQITLQLGGCGEMRQEQPAPSPAPTSAPSLCQ